jgi:hypothetical protein
MRPLLFSAQNLFPGRYGIIWNADVKPVKPVKPVILFFSVKEEKEVRGA